MKPRERVFAALEHREPDRVPRFEVWIDNDDLVAKVGDGDLQRTHVNLGLDCVMLPNQNLPESNAWGDGVDEWGRIWNNGWYAGGVVETEADLERYSPPLNHAEQHFDPVRCRKARELYPDHCFIFGSHIAPFTAAYMSMGMERFFMSFLTRKQFIRKLLNVRTEWCIAVCQEAVSLGAEVLILGEDAAHGGGPMISPQQWREFVLPHHRRIVEEVDAPVIWHSDGNITSLLPMAIEAGFAGVHSLEPGAGVDLGQVKQEFGDDLVLIGNADPAPLCQSDLDAVRQEVRRCMEQGAPGGGYMFSTCSSVFKGMNLDSILEMYRYAGEIGWYPEVRSTA
jgi:uroporphyrinogen decarboxylase